MAFYVQYDPTNGQITGWVSSQGDAPAHDNQLVFSEYLDVSGKMVDVATDTLVDAPEVS